MIIAYVYGKETSSCNDINRLAALFVVSCLYLDNATNNVKLFFCRYHDRTETHIFNIVEFFLDRNWLILIFFYVCLHYTRGIATKFNHQYANSD